MHWVDVMLRRWGKASVRAMDGGLGYTKSCLATLNRTNSTWHGSPPSGALTSIDFHDLNTAIQGLEEKERLAVVAYYQLADSYRQAGVVLNCNRMTVQRRVESAQTNLAKALYEMEQARKAGYVV